MKKNNTGGSRKLSVIIMFVVIILALFLLLINFMTDWLWFKEMGYVSVFFKQLFTELKVGIPVFIILTPVSYTHLDVYKRQMYIPIL